MKTLKDTIEEMLNSPVLTAMTGKYKNSIDLSGWIIRKPKVVKHDTKKTQSCSFILYQINNIKGVLKIDSYECITYITDLVRQLEKLDNIIFVATIGKVRHHYKYGDYTQVLEMTTIAELTLPLAEPYKTKEN